MTARIPVYLKHTNTSTNTDDLLLPVTTADQIEESSDKQFISQAEKATLSNKQDNLGYTPVNKAGDTLNGPLILSSDAITDARQAVTKSYVDLKVSELVNSAPAALDTINELAAAIGNDPNFAVSVSSIVGNKLDKTAASAVAEANKLLYLDSDRNLNTNASSASKLKNAYTLTLTGDVTGSVSMDGSMNVSMSTIVTQQPVTYNAMTAEELEAGVQTAARVISAKTLADYVSTHGGNGGSGSGGEVSIVSWSNITGKPNTFTPSDHNQDSSTINALTGYSKPVSTSALATTDTLNEALGKLEKALDGKQASGSYLASDGTAADSNKLGGTVASSYALKTDIPTVPTFATVATSGDYGDLLNAPIIPTKVSDLTNDSGFINSVAWNDVSSKPSFATVATSGDYDDLLNKPTIPTKVSDLVNDVSFVTTVAWDGISDKPSFATVATSGDYDDLLNKPSIPANVSDLTNDSGFITSVAWNDISSKPSFSTVATSGDYADLLNTPTVPTKVSDLTNDSGFITSVAWNDIYSKPTIPSKVSDLTNDSGFISSVAWTDISNKPTIPSKVSDLTNDSGFITGIAWTDVTSKPTFAAVATSGDYTDLSNKPTVPVNVSDLNNDSGFITGVAWTDITDKPSLATVATTGSYSDLSSKPTIPTKVSDLTNDSGFITGIAWNDISSKPSFATVATSGSYSDLTNTPTIPTNVSDLSNDSGFITGVAWNDITSKPSTFSPSSHNHVVSEITDFPTIPSYSNFVGSGSTAAAGLVPAPSTIAGTDKYLREDGTWAIPPNNSASYTNFVGSGSAASAGLVPQPPTTAGSTKYLCENGTWAIPPGASYSDFVGSGSTAAAGLVPAPSTTAGTTKYLCEDGNWSVPSLSVTWNDVSNKPSTFSPSTHSHVGSEITLTGYSIASTAASVSATDTLNEALGKLQKSINGKQDSGSYASASHTHDDYVPISRTINSKALSSNISLTASDVGAAASTHSHVGSEVTLTGYSKAGSASSIAATDTVNEGLGKLEKALDSKQDSGSFVTTDTAQNITGEKTFVGTKRIKFKQSTNNDKLGFTLFGSDDTEKGYLEYNPSNAVDGVSAMMTLGNYASKADGLTNIGFRRYSSINGAAGAYNLLAPLVSNAKTHFTGLNTTTYTNFYMLLGITDGTTMLKADNTGVLNISSILPSVPANISDLNNDSGFITSVAWTDITNKPSTFDPASHSHTASDISLMTGYSKPNATSDIAATDTLNEAIGKLEKALDGKQASGSYLSTSGTAADSSKLGGTVAADYALKTDIPTIPTKVSDLTNDSGFITGIAWNDVSSKPNVFTPDAHNQASNTINALTGYSKPNATSALSTSDTLNDALGKLEKAIEGKQASGSYLTTTGTAADSSKLGGTAAADYALKTDIPSVPTKVSDLNNDSGFITSVSWSDVSSKPSTFAPEAHNQASSTINALTGYDKSVTGGTGALGTSDTLNKALAKLENALDGKQASGSYLTTTGTAADSSKLGGTAAASYALKTDIPTVPTKVSDLTNDSGFITSVSWNDVSSKPSTFAPEAHNQASSTINALTGYSKSAAGGTGVLNTSDTLNIALAKIENALDGKQASGSYASSSHNHTKSEITDFPTIPTITDTYSSTSSNGMSGKAVASALSGITASGIGAALSSHTHVGTEVTLTGYSKASSVASIAATDTVSVALGKLEKALDGKQASGTYLTSASTLDATKLSGIIPVGCYTNTTYSDFVGSGPTAASGLVPAPSTTAGTSKYLCEDGSWAVPAGTYSHPITSGNKHIPSGGSTGQILKWSSDGTAVWANETTGSGGTYTDFVGSGSSAASGLVPAPSTTAGTTKYLCEDGSWSVPTGTTYTAFVGSGSSAAAGLVPKPSTTTGTTKFLREDGYWEVPPNTTYNIADASNAGIVKLYSTSGNNTDGTMTQAAIATAITAAINAVGSASNMSF